MSRLETKFRLVREFASLFDPIRRLLFNDAEPNPSKTQISLATAGLNSDWGIYYPRVEAFCTIQGMVIWAYLCALQDPVAEIVQLCMRGSLDSMRSEFPALHARAEAALLDIPADDPDVMMPPNSPFQTYLRLLAICGTTTSRLQMFDPYLDAEVFDRYLPDVGKGVEITLVTEVANMRKVRVRQRIVAISELVASERPAQYRLLETTSIHDRHLRADDKIYHLGGSAKDASKKDFYSITGTDGSPALHSILDSIIAGSAAWYQPGMPRHRHWCSTCSRPSDVLPNGNCVACNGPT